MSGPSARARSRASSSRFFCSVASMVRRWSGASGAAATTASAACGASIGIGLRPSAPARCLARAISSAGNDAGRGDAVEHAVAGVARRLDRAVRAALLRRLRQRDQQRRLAQRQPPRLLAEIGERRGAHAFEVAAVGREAEVEREDLVLGRVRARAGPRAPSGAASPRSCARRAARAAARPAW